MGNSIIASIEASKFDFEEFINEIRRNLSRELNTDFIPKYMENIEGEYTDSVSSENEGLSANCIYQDILNNDRILYVSFVYNCQTYGVGGFLCGDGQELDGSSTYSGEVIHDDLGFLLEIKNKTIIFRKGEYGGRIEEHSTARVVRNAGDFEYIMQEFLYKYTY